MNEIGQYLTGIALSTATLGALVAAVTQMLKRSFRIKGNAVKVIPVALGLTLGMIIAFSFPEGEEAATLPAILLRGVLSGAMIAIAAIGIKSATSAPKVSE